MLYYDDLSWHNVLVDSAGCLSGIVDRECVSTMPLRKTCQLPHFLVGLHGPTRRTVVRTPLTRTPAPSTSCSTNTSASTTRCGCVWSSGRRWRAPRRAGSSTRTRRACKRTLAWQWTSATTSGYSPRWRRSWMPSKLAHRIRCSNKFSPLCLIYLFHLVRN